MSTKTFEQCVCVVCDSNSAGINFGVATCIPCKAFFRRNAIKLGAQEFKCRYEGDCIITHENRRLCNCCRLAKCFRVGMKKSLILSDEKREARNRLVAINCIMLGNMPKEQSAPWARPPQIIHMPSNQIQNISASDQVVLTNIFHVYENTCIKGRNTRFQSFPNVAHNSIHEFFNEMAPLLEIFIEYFKFIPQFNTLTMDDRIRVIRNHCGTMININQPLLYATTTSNIIRTWVNVFNCDITERLLKRNQIIGQFIFDPIILKVLLIIAVLSSGNNRNIVDYDLNIICDDTLSIFAAQNFYVELLWRYIISRSPNEIAAVKLYNRLVLFLLYIQRIDIYIDTYMDNFKHEIQQTEPIIQSMWPQVINEENANNTQVNNDAVQ